MKLTQEQRLVRNAKIIAMYRAGHSSNECAKAHGMTGYGVRQMLCRAGVHCRTRGDGIRLRIARARGTAPRGFFARVLACLGVEQ